MKEIALIGLSQSMFFMIIVSLKKRKHLKDFFLIGFFLCIGIELLYRYLLYSDSYFNNSRLVLFDIVYWALFGPILLFYIISVINKNLNFKSVYLLHLLPLVISLVSVANYIFNISSYNSFAHFYNTANGIEKAGLLIWEFSSPVYLVFTLIILFKHKRRVKDYFSNLERKELNWLLYLTTGFSTFIYLSYIFWIFTDLLPTTISLKVLTIVLGIYVLILGVYGYRQESIFLEGEQQQNDSKDPVSRRKKYQKTRLHPDEKEAINQKLMEIMDRKKPYLESEITISELANQLQTSVYKLSQVINDRYNRNFFDFINTYRVNDVKKLLSASETNDSKIESIAYGCGFNSKSSFYSIFKKHTHLTPTEYRNKLFKIHG